MGHTRSRQLRHRPPPNSPTPIRTHTTPIANVAWEVTSTTSATLTTPGTHDTKITSITIAGANGSLNKTWTTLSGNLTVQNRGFTISGTNLTIGSGNAGIVTIN